MNKIFIAFTLLTVLFISSCEIGLGRAVDTLPPEVSITGPLTNSILRDAFVLSGECSDDTGIKEVIIELKNTELGKTYDKVTVVPENNKWSVTLNEVLSSGKYPFGDGKYDITVHSYDLQGKDSGPRNISIVIDNTPPLMVLTRPTSGDKYGQKFDITGQIADDSNIDLMEVSVFSKETDELLKTIQLKNVPPTIDLSAAVFGDEAYSEIYGTDKFEGDKTFYCEIKAYDAARKYPEVEGDKGNETAFFYMNDDIYDLMQDYKLTELYHIKNGLYARSVSTDDALSILSIPAGQEGSIRTERNDFVLNPLNNPTFEFNKFQEVTCYEDLLSNDIHSEKSIEIKINVGRDDTPLNDETFEVYAKRVKKDGAKWKEADDEAENPALVKMYPAFDNTIAKNGSNRVINISMSNDYGLVVGETYILDVRGNDKNGNNIFNNGIEYGFYIDFSDKAPTLKIINPSQNTIYVNRSGKIELSGTTAHDEQKPKVYAQFVKEGEEEILQTVEFPVSVKERNIYEFSKELNPADFISSANLETSETYIMNVYASVGGNESSPTPINIRYDVGIPNVTVSSVLPLADTSALAGGKEYNVNGKISIKVGFNDDETSIKSAGYRYKDKNNQTIEETILKTSSSTVEIDTNELKDKADLDLVFFAEDQAGNKVEYCLVYDDSNEETENPKYYVDQATDKPIIMIEESQLRKVDSYSSENISILSRMASITGTVSDDDGLEKYKITLYEVDSENNVINEEAVSEVTADNLNGVYTKQFTMQLPNENNIYKIVISATDKKKVEGESEVTSEWVSFVKVAGGAPTVSITSGNKGIVSSAGQKNTLTIGGKFSGAHTPGTNEAKHLKLFLLENTEEAKNDSTKWLQIFDATDVHYGTDALTKEWTATDSVNNLPVKTEGEHIILVRILDGNGNSTDDTLTYTIDNTKPDVPSMEGIIDKITSSSYQFKTTSADNVSGSGLSGLYYQIAEEEKTAVNASALTAANGWTEVNGDGSFSFYQTFVGAESETVPAGQLKEGVYILSMYAVDNAGNISSRAGKQIIADFTLPVIGDTNYSGVPEKTKLLPDGSIFVRKPTAAELSSDETLADAYFTLSGSVTDTLKISDIVLSAKLGDTEHLIHLKDKTNAQGEASPLNPTVTKADTKWTWSINLPFEKFEDGTWVFNYKAYDQSGRYSEQNTNIIVDRTPPELHYKWNRTISTEDWLNVNNVTVFEYTTGEGISGSSKDKVSYFQTTEEKSLDELKALSDEQWTGFSGASRTFSLEEGLNYIYIRSVDEAGNISYSNSQAGSATFVCKVDRTKPVLNIVKPNSGSMIGVQEDTVIEVSIDEDENASGINYEETYVKVFESGDGNVLIGQFPLLPPQARDGDSVNHKATIPSSTWNNRNDAEVKIVAYVKDNAGNENDTSAKKHLLTFDRELPEIQINNPVASTVNGVIRVNGTSSDNGGSLRNVILYRTPVVSETGTDVVITTSSAVVATERTKKLVLLHNDYATFENGDANVWEVSYDQNSTKTHGFKTNSFEDGTEFTIYAVATDQSGNINYASKAITVDQDSDRPVIKLNNFTAKSDSVWSTTEETALWHKENKIRGTVSDDDGIEYLKVATYNFTSRTWNAFSDNLYKNGSWETPDLSDGNLALKFEVKDKDGKVFTSVTSPSDAEALQATPKITDAAGNTLALKGATENGASSILYAKVDTAQPVISDVGYSTDGTNYSSAQDLNNRAFGGPDSKAYIRFTATDSNGIKAAKVYLKGTSSGAETTVETYTASKSGNKYTAEISTSTTPEGVSNLKFVIEVEDGSGAKNTEDYNIRLDNEGPVLAVSYTKDLYYGSVSNQLVGTSSDAANTPVADVYFRITEKKDALTEDETAVGSGWERITDRTDTIHKYTSAMAWIINFTTSNQRTNGEYSASPLNDYLDAIFTPDAQDEEDKASNMETVRDVTIWYYGVDQLGNAGTIAHTDLVVDPSGDRPIVTVDFPTNDNDSTGGSVRLNGSAQTPSAEVGVSTIWIQIDPTYVTTFNSAWESELSGIISGREEILGYKVESAYYYDKNGDRKDSGISFKDASGNAVDAKGILADMTSTTWSKYINKMDEFADASGSASTMAIRVYAISPTGKVSSPLTRIFKIDPDAPQITNLQLVQYADNTNKTGAKTVKAYADDMWVSGEWWLEADISDNDLGNVTYKNAANVESSLDITGKQSVDGKQVYKFSQKVGSSTPDGYGTLTYTINAQESGGQKKSSQKVIRLNYDNKKPVFSVTNELDNAANVTNKIINSNGYFTPEGTASDTGAQSGIDKIITYYKCSDTSAVDPLAEKSGTAFRNTHAVTSEAGTGIPLVTGITAAAVDGNVYQVKVATSLVLDFVRKGGLVRISNVYYVIQKVETSGSDKVFTLDKSVPSGFTAVDFAVAQVVEEGSTEVAGNDVDADGLIEKLQNNAGTYSWFASFDSNNIKDGSITAGYVAYDKAGNYTLISKATKVINNAPRIAGFRYGTDDDGDNTIRGTELKDTLSGLNASKDALADGKEAYRGNNFPVQGSAASPLFTIKGITEIYPEVVGGNGNLTYSYTVTKNGAVSASRTVSNVSLKTNDDLVTYDSIVGNEKISIGLTDFLSGDSKGPIADGVNEFSFTISDSTTGGAQTAGFSFFADVVVQDNDSPSAKIRPFFWHRNGKPDSAVTKISQYYNSIYDGDLTQGHIELEADWLNASGYDSTADDGVSDKDPKVSGKIVLRGKAHDNVLLEGLWFKMDGFGFTGVTASGTGTTTEGYSKLAEYTPGTGWAYKKTETDFTAASPSNFYIKVLNEVIDQDGHTVDWELGINTASVTGVAATDVEVYVLATDRGKLQLKSGGGTEYVSNVTIPTSTAQPQDETADENWNDAGKWSPYYRMDIVPYVTGVETVLSKVSSTGSVYGRTAKGHYGVNGGSPSKADNTTNQAETVKISGFNLNANGYIEVTASTLSSGNYLYSVNSISILNNLNNNDAKGSFEGTLSEDNYSTYAYNRLPNGINNNLLTDDVVFDVWEINSRAAKPISGTLTQPVMSINQADKNIGVAFVNGPTYFSMGGKVANKTYSYDYWIGGIEAWTSVGFVYDRLGYSYATAAGGDFGNEPSKPYEASADKFRLFTDRWGRSNISTKGYYDKHNSIRFDSIGQVNALSTAKANDRTGGNAIEIEKQRFQSSSLATVVNNSATNVYLAYYDLVNDQIRFRWGTYSADNRRTDSVGTDSGYPGTTKNETESGLFKDEYGNANLYDNNKLLRNYALGAASLIAGRTRYGTHDTGYEAGPYVSIAAIDKSTITRATDDVIVAVWYDDEAELMYYAYNEKPKSITAGEYLPADTEWKVEGTDIFGKGVGEYCKIAVDAKGGIHIAAYDSSNYGLKYAYLPNYKGYSSAKVANVDSYGTSSGEELNIDVGLDKDGHPVPYISYYGNKKPMVAYYTGSTAIDSLGADDKFDGISSDKYTQNWEVSIIPTSSKVIKDHINVGLWKTGTHTGTTVTKDYTNPAYITASTATNSLTTGGSGFSATGNNGVIYGNGTANPVLGYAIRPNTTEGYFETAQMRGSN